MARYEHLPIYKQALDVAVHFEKVVAGFSRYHKYTLGTELRNQSRAVVALIMKANAARDKQPHLLWLREALDELLISVRIAKVAPGILPPATPRHLYIPVLRKRKPSRVSSPFNMPSNRWSRFAYRDVGKGREQERKLCGQNEGWLMENGVGVEWHLIKRN